LNLTETLWFAEKRVGNFSTTKLMSLSSVHPNIQSSNTGPFISVFGTQCPDFTIFSMRSQKLIL
jgi:hypothetical protein